MLLPLSGGGGVIEYFSFFKPAVEYFRRKNVGLRLEIFQLELSFWDSC
jgi:hypothetical protein